MLDGVPRRGIARSLLTLFMALEPGGCSRSAQLAPRLGATRQPTGEMVRDLQRLGCLEVGTNPGDARGPSASSGAARIRPPRRPSAG